MSTNRMEEPKYVYNYQPIESHSSRHRLPRSDSKENVRGEDGESESLLKGSSGEGHQRPEEVHDRSERDALLDPSSSSIEKYPFLLLNLITILNSGTNRIYSSLMDQYLYQRFANDLLGNATGNTASKPCVNDTNNTGTSATLQIQSQTAQLSLYLALADYGLALAPCVLLGAYSALMSRRALLLIPNLAGAFKSLVVAAVIYWSMDVSWLFLGYAVGGLGGGVSGMILGIFVYMSDITSRGKRRTVFMSFLEGLKGFISGILFYATGQLIENAGFEIPALMAAGCMTLSVVFIVLLPDRKLKTATAVQGEESDWSLQACCQRFMLPFGKNQHPLVRKMILLALVAFLIIVCAVFGQSKVRNLYLMNVPFCWDAVAIGWFLSAQEITYNLFTMFAVPVFYRCLPGMGLGILGIVSAMAGMTMYAFANTSLDIYLIIGLTVANNVAFGLIRGETSRLLDLQSQGSLFATVAVFESLSLLCGTPTLYVYRVTADFFTGFTFLLMDLLLLVALVLLSIYQVTWLRYTREIKSKELIVEQYGSINS